MIHLSAAGWPLQLALGFVLSLIAWQRRGHELLIPSYALTFLPSRVAEQPWIHSPGDHDQGRSTKRRREEKKKKETTPCETPGLPSTEA